MRVGAKRPDFDAEYGPAPSGTGWMQVTVGNTRYELGTGPTFTYAELEVHVHEPNSSKPGFVVFMTPNTAIDLTAGGLSYRLPGIVKDAGVTIANPPRGDQWVSTQAEIQVTEFGAVGEPVAGWFRGTMSARLNRDPEPIHGRFRATRKPDHHSP